MRAPVDFSRRAFVRRAVASATTLGLFPYLSALAAPQSGGVAAGLGPDPFADIDQLLPPDAQGICLPPGWTSRIVAFSGRRPASQSSYRWHPFPDGGATFAWPDGGWVYLNNSEVPWRGGVGALRFDVDGNVVDAWAVLSGTTCNCAGGATPWKTWLSCEEFGLGRVWECDPLQRHESGRALPALGIFAHEAVAVDPERRVLYMTEDDGDGRFYRFVPSANDWPEGSPRAALREGRLQVLRMSGFGDGLVPSDVVDVSIPFAVEWADVEMPWAPQAQVRAMLGADAPGVVFKGGEGVWYAEGAVHFSTKGDDRIWRYDIVAGTLKTIYDFATASGDDKVLSGVDNLTLSPWGDVLVAEDGGNMELCVIRPDGTVRAVLRVVGQDRSEITGLAFSPDFSRLYFNSQRGGLNGAGEGISYELRLPT